jgi:hypothetical protein
MKFEKAFVAVLETLSVAMTAANSSNPVVNFFRCVYAPRTGFRGLKMVLSYSRGR